MDGQAQLIAEAEQKLGPKAVITDRAEIKPWLTDWRGRVHGSAPAILAPATTEEVVDIVKLAAKHRGLHDADPPDADAFGSCRQPKILDGAASARAHGLGLSGGPQDGFFAISRQTVGAVSQGSFTYDLPAAVDCLLEVRSILGEGQQREASRLQASGLL